MGFGSIGAGVLPLVLRHLAVDPAQITLLTAPDRGLEAAAAAQRYGTQYLVVALTPDNYEQVRPQARVVPSPEILFPANPPHAHPRLFSLRPRC